jgi:hypothetical protein
MQGHTLPQVSAHGVLQFHESSFSVTMCDSMGVEREPFDDLNTFLLSGG